MTGAQLRERFLEYFRQQGHAIIPSASLIPENDPTVLFTTAGMHPLVPYLLGQPHPQGTKLANVQKCLRTDDIEEVGDDTHLTFFEMLGNWSLGSYLKQEAIEMSFEFLTAPQWLDIPLQKLSVTCFEGDADAPRDEESRGHWRRLGLPQEQIFFFGKKENWWGPPGATGPCGPDTEIFFDTKQGPADARPNDASGRFVEIWNNVFMEYEKTTEGTFRPLKQKNVDTGMGLERTIAVLTGKKSVYESDLFEPLLAVIAQRSAQHEPRAARIVADHIRAATFLIADGVLLSNVDRGYVLRRLLRRALTHARALKFQPQTVMAVADATIATYRAQYPELSNARDRIATTIQEEETKFGETLDKGLKEFERLTRNVKEITGGMASALASTHGLPLELTKELARERGIPFVREEEYEQDQAKHQDISRAGVQRRFQGGLADHSAQTVKLHTATHLLHAALRKVLGQHVEQKGSNITPERLRFDFSHPKKLSPEEIRAVESLVNEQISNDLPVTRTVMTPEEAKAAGALGFFEKKYGDQVSVYTVGDFSKEICGGPHVSRTGVIGRFRITKEESLAVGIRRIRAVIE